jgi:hypothetical protein
VSSEQHTNKQTVNQAQDEGSENKKNRYDIITGERMNAIFPCQQGVANNSFKHYQSKKENLSKPLHLYNWDVLESLLLIEIHLVDGMIMN